MDRLVAFLDDIIRFTIREYSKGSYDSKSFWIVLNDDAVGIKVGGNKSKKDDVVNKMYLDRSTWADHLKNKLESNARVNASSFVLTSVTMKHATGVGKPVQRTVDAHVRNAFENFARVPPSSNKVSPPSSPQNMKNVSGIHDEYILRDGLCYMKTKVAPFYKSGKLVAVMEEPTRLLKEDEDCIKRRYNVIETDVASFKKTARANGYKKLPTKPSYNMLHHETKPQKNLH
jgi:hypothetical protein